MGQKLLDLASMREAAIDQLECSTDSHLVWRDSWART